MIFRTLSPLLLACQLVSAIPFAQVARSVPPEVAHIALDEVNNQYIAYNLDGSLYGKYSVDVKRDFYEDKRDTTGTCAPLSIDEAKQLPGFKLLEQYADQTWGTGSRKEVTNPDNADQRGQGATACVSGEVVNVELSGNPTCISNQGETGASPSGTNGSIAVAVTQGFSNSGTWSVTSSSSIGVAVKVSATVKIPEILEIGGEVTTSAEFTNQIASGFSTTANQQVTNTATFAAPADKICKVTFDSKSCDVQGHGRVRYLAGGWVWFEYDDKVQDHFKWAVNIESIISNIDDRSSFLEFTGSMKGSTDANFVAKCE